MAELRLASREVGFDATSRSPQQMIRRVRDSEIAQPPGSCLGGIEERKDRSTLWGFVSISGSAYRRIPIFRYKMACKTFLCALEAYRRKYGFTVHAYALMPNHYHKQILNWLRRENLTHLVGYFEQKRARRRRRDSRYCVLQHGSYVRQLEGGQVLLQKVRYIHFNPVRERLAPVPEAYPFSSARAYAGHGLSLVKVGLLKRLRSNPPRLEPRG
jgi:REP element-mobilizing transposase RayT